jgi:PBSX family phage terminase large subunit
MSAIMRRFGEKAHNFVVRHPSQDKRHTLLEGSVRSSKTFAVDAKTITQLCPYELPANAKRFMTGTTKQTLYRNVLLDLFSIVGKENYSYNHSSGELWLFGKQWFVVGAKDEASYKQILGSTVGLWVGDEVVEYPMSFTAQMFMRMSLDESRSYLTTNPGTPHCYLKTGVIDNSSFRKNLEVIHFTLDDNPNLSREAKQQIIDSQVGIFKLRYIDGLWVIAEGSIYRDAWNEAENCYADTEHYNERGDIKYRTAPVGLKNRGGHVDHWFAVDCGVDHPQVYGEFYDDGMKVWLDRVWRWDSRAMMQQKTDGQYADDLEKFMGGKGAQVIVPPEAASFKVELEHRGFWVTDADNAVSEGIHTVSTLLNQRRLLVNVDQCEKLEERIPSYAWDEKAAKRGEEQPLKQNDDDVDMLRYGVHGKIQAWRLTS